MKKLFWAILLCVCPPAFAQYENALILSKRNSTDTNTEMRIMLQPPTGVTGLVSMTNGTGVTLYTLPGTRMSLSTSGGYNYLDVSAPTGAEVSAALGFTPYDSSNPNGYVSSAALSSKFNTPTCALTNYLRGDGSCMVLPVQVQTDWTASTGLGVVLHKPTLATVATSGAYADLSGTPVINRARVTTATDGTYTWAYPTACPAATVPVIQITPEGSASITYNTVIVGVPTNTSASIKITQVTDVVVLTIHVLGIAPASATVVHLTAVCP